MSERSLTSQSLMLLSASSVVVYTASVCVCGAYFEHKFWQFWTQLLHKSAFNTVVRRHKLGEVENDYAFEKLFLSAIFMPNIFTIGRNLTKFWQ